ncbi:hypothetical protein DdX_19381 [Ditylenchus destructor]|uniref:Uncharacterized protein n=1 Tax=Ditylenchus destructor TaxID=166010 RepID=A0AAD4QSC7_9BILA|nr:hypothetical protein DdX_19381 [Ditylenchus destructor]
MGQCISIRGVKRHRTNSSPDLNSDEANISRKSVYIPNDTWLEALKFLTCPQWSQNRYVCRQINGIIERNISHLPKMVLACADMYYNFEDRAQEWQKRRLNKNTVVAFETVMQEKQSTQWFVKRGFPIKAPVGIPASDLLIAADKWTGECESNVNICIHGSAQEKVPYSDEKKRLPSSREPVLFYAQFNPVSNRYSWHYLAQFLKFIYHPMSYVKEVKMFAVNQTFIDSLKCNIGSTDNEPRYIRCESFTLKRFQLSYDGVKKQFRFFEKRVVGKYF